MLKTLLFCHGREAYRRNTYLITYMFYKNVLYVIPIWMFGWISFFSGTAIYNNVLVYFLFEFVWLVTFEGEPVLGFV